MMFRTCLVASCVLALAAGCGGNKKGNNPNGNGGECSTGVDFDGDGYGVGCEAGPDCNDADADYNVDCCFDGNEFTGCPCDGGDEARSCFDGDPSLAGVGACTEGTRTCLETNTWSACEGGVPPRMEFCDGGADNDCDGDSDEGVLNACGNCMAGCDTSSVGDGTPFPTEDDDPNVDQTGTGLNPDGDIVLDSAQVETFFLWIANDGEGTVSKINTRTGDEVGRYPAVVKSNGRLIEGLCPDGCDPANVPDWDDMNGSDATNRPSRTAIDAFGDCWLANRAHGPSSGAHQSTATKYMNRTGADPMDLAAAIDPASSDCRDFNGNGVIDTSRDLSGDGKIDPTLTGANQEFFPDDECVVATVMLGDDITSGEKGARALAIDAGGYDVDFGGPDPSNPGNAWIGMYSESAFYRVTLKFNGLAPEATTIRAPTTGTLPGDVHPYGAAIDSQGIVWAPGREEGDELVGIRSDSTDFDDPALTFVEESAGDYLHDVPVGNNYGIVIDLQDNVWLGGWTSESIHRYDPVAKVWTDWQVDDGNVRGMAIDLNGYIWAAISTGGKVARIPADAAAGAGYVVYDVNAATTGGGTGPVGVGVDFDGQVWLVNRGTSNVSKLTIDVANDLDGDGKIGDPEGVTMGAPISNLVATNYDYDDYASNPAGENDARPYTYSDFTGLSLRAVTRPAGQYSIAMQGCPGGTEADWQAIEFDADVPLNTSVEVFVQVGNDLATLDQQPFYGPWTVSPADLDMPAPMSGQEAPPDGVFLRVTFILSNTDNTSTPIVKSYNVEWSCPSEGVD